MKAILVITRFKEKEEDLSGRDIVMGVYPYADNNKGDALYVREGAIATAQQDPSWTCFSAISSIVDAEITITKQTKLMGRTQ